MESKRIEESATEMCQLIMPNDTNPLGNLMGGNLMRWMDIVAGICSSKHCNANTVTVSCDNISFKKPILLGDVITLKAFVTRAFTTSVEIYVEVFAASIKGTNHRRCNEAYFTFVALDDENKKPIPVPRVLPLTGEETKRYEGALRRRELRLLLSGRIEPSQATNIRSLFEKQ